MFPPAQPKTRLPAHMWPENIADSQMWQATTFRRDARMWHPIWRQTILYCFYDILTELSLLILTVYRGTRTMRLTRPLYNTWVDVVDVVVRYSTTNTLNVSCVLYQHAFFFVNHQTCCMMTAFTFIWSALVWCSNNEIVLYWFMTFCHLFHCVFGSVD